MTGTGGCGWAIGVGSPCGDGVRNVRSAMLPELPLLSNLKFGPLPDEDIEELRRMVRLVCTSATLVGDNGRARRAAAAAADDSARFGFWLLDAMKAAAAAVEAALGLAVLTASGYNAKKKDTTLAR
jgi:hypothetical protein